jgi:hypothetical protein
MYLSAFFDYADQVGISRGALSITMIKGSFPYIIFLNYDMSF